MSFSENGSRKESQPRVNFYENLHVYSFVNCLEAYFDTLGRIIARYSGTVILITIGLWLLTIGVYVNVDFKENDDEQQV